MYLCHILSKEPLDQAVGPIHMYVTNYWPQGFEGICTKYESELIDMDRCHNLLTKTGIHVIFGQKNL